MNLLLIDILKAIIRTYLSLPQATFVYPYTDAFASVIIVEGLTPSTPPALRASHSHFALTMSSQKCPRLSLFLRCNYLHNVPLTTTLSEGQVLTYHGALMSRIVSYAVDVAT